MHFPPHKFRSGRSKLKVQINWNSSMLHYEKKISSLFCPKKISWEICSPYSHEAKRLCLPVVYEGKFSKQLIKQCYHNVIISPLATSLSWSSLCCRGFDSARSLKGIEIFNFQLYQNGAKGKTSCLFTNLWTQEFWIPK